MNKLNVMHVTYDMRIGGTEMVIRSIIEGSNRDSDLNMSIFCIEEPIGPWGVDLLESGIPIYSCNRREGFDTHLIKQIRTQVKKLNIDVLHCHQYTPWVYGVFATIGLKTKVIFTEHGRFYPDISSWKRKFVNPILSYFTAAITSISDATKQALVEYEFLNANKISVIHNGIKGIEKSDTASDELRAQYHISSDTFIVGTIARMDPIKNHLLMIRAVSLCIEAGIKIHFVLVGDGETRAEIEQEISNLQLQKHVTLSGYQKDPSRFFNLFDLFLLTSFSEGMSMTLLEAMSIGLPCVVTDVGGNAEVVSHNQTGRVIASNNVEQLAEQLKDLQQSPEKLNSMSVASLCRFEEAFTQSIMNANYKDCYRAITSR